LNPTNPAYHNYGGRGITICQRWLDNFANFKADMGPKPTGLTIDRIDNDLGYSPENCRWADKKTQSNNRRPLNPDNFTQFTFNGETKILTEWAAISGIRLETLWVRIFYLHWPLEKALNTPPRRRRTTFISS
jgi:hypothetical protein